MLQIINYSETAKKTAANPFSFKSNNRQIKKTQNNNRLQQEIK